MTSELKHSIVPSRRRSIVLGEGNVLLTGEEELVGKKTDTLFIVSSRLPLVINVRPESGELDITPCNFRLCLYKRQAIQCFAGRKLWVGLLDCSSVGNETQRLELTDRLLKEFDCLPVFISPQTLISFTDFCKKVLWPTTHSLPIKETLSDEVQWGAYQEVSNLIAEEMGRFMKPDDYVWVHDYHFFLLPKRLKAISRSTKVGFFLHTPFPTTEFFRTLPMRAELLNGVLESDLIAFQTFDYVRHFNRSCVRILGYDTSPNGVDCRNGHLAAVRVIPVGVDFSQFSKYLEPNSNKFLPFLKEKFKDKKVIFSRDTLEPIKGVPLKFKAFEKFLMMYPEWIGRVVLVQLLSPPSSGHCSFAPHPAPFNLISPPSPTNLELPVCLPDSTRLAPFSILPPSESSAILFPPANSDGYSPISSRSAPSSNYSSAATTPRVPSLMVQGNQFPPLSPYIAHNYLNLPSPKDSSSVQLFTTPDIDVMKIKPTTSASIPDPMSYNFGSREDYELLESQVNDIAARINARFGDLHTQPVQCYFHHVTVEELTAFYAHADAALITPLRDGMNLTSFEFILCQNEKKSPVILSEFCGSARSLSGAIHVNPWYLEGVASGINSALKMDDEEKALKQETLFSFVYTHDAKRWGRNFLMELNSAALISERPTSKKLNPDFVKMIYLKSKKRAFFLDYDGTLSPLVSHPSLAAPTPKLLQLLRKLTDDEKNQVSVLSGRDRESLDKWLSSIPNLNLFAEHGSFQKLKGTDHWEFAHPNLDTSWHDVVIPILKYWEARTPGSFIEYKNVNLVWHYRQADLEFGEWQARELKNQLDENIIARGLPVEILSGKKALEIRPHGFHKGTAVRRMLEEDDYDFVFVIGDDVTDEDMFTALEEEEANKSTVPVEVNETAETSSSTPEQPEQPTTSTPVVPADGKFSVVVGRHDSRAKWYVDGTRDVFDILSALVN